MRQLADEPHGVGQEGDTALGAHHLARRRIERGEQSVLDEHLGARERVEQRALARVRVADEGGAKLATPPAALRLALALDRLEVALEPRDTLAHKPAVRLELGLPRAARPDPAGLPL